ncbi:MAG: Ig-like domain repeat protein, partial [Actinomycetota bacterium]
EAWGVGGGSGPAPSTTTLVSSANPATAGTSVTFTATVTGTNPSGSVSFTDGGATISGCGAAALSGAGNTRTAACTTSSLAVGTRSIVAHYGGDAANAASSSATLSQVINTASDTTAPSVPTALTASAVSASQINLAWTASTDNVGVTAYQVYRGASLLTTLGAVTSHSDTGLAASTLYSYTVAACDAAGNCSGQSSAASATTQAGGASTNVALAANGALATASSTHGSGAYPLAAVNNNERAGAGAGSGSASNGVWVDATPTGYPDWVQITFNGAKPIDRVVVYTLQDNYASPIEPTDTLTFGLYGVTDFTVQGWDGAAWVTLGTPLTNNNLVKRTIPFTATTTDRIRVNITRALASYSRLTEIEAWGN